MSDTLIIVLTAGLVATACGLLSPLLIVRRVALMADAVSHAVLPGIVAVFLLLGTRSPVWVIVGAAVVAVICVVSIDALRESGLVHSDAAIALVFPALFALGVLGVHRWTENIHLDLDSTIYGEIAFTPLNTITIAGIDVPQSIIVLAPVVALNALLIVAFWKELKVTSFDPGFSRVAGFAPRLVARGLLIAVALTAVSAFESVGAILVIALLIVPGATAYLLSNRLSVMVAISVAVGWIAAVGGYAGASAIDASIAGAMGLTATLCFAVALVVAPRHGLIAQARRRATVRRAEARAAIGA